MTISWITEKRNINELIPAEYNPRKLDEKSYKDLDSSLSRFNLADPIIINTNNKIIGGHQRINVLKAKGFSGEVDVRIPNRELNTQEEQELNLRLNKNIGQWDYDLLANFDESLLKDVGFDSSELDNIFQLDITPEDDAVPGIPAEAKSKRGEIYKLGRHRIMCGDSTDAGDVALLMDGKKSDMVFTDPPYQMETKGGGIFKESKAMKDIHALGIDNFNPAKLIKMADVQIFCCNKNLVKEYILLSESWGEVFDICFYKKQNTVPNYGGHLMTDVEYLMVIGNQAPKNYGLDKQIYSKCFIGDKDADNLCAWNKPVALVEKFIFIFSMRDSICFDGFLGSGSTLIACEKTNRICHGMEIDPVYCDVIIERWEKFTGQKAEKLDGQA